MAQRSQRGVEQRHPVSPGTSAARAQRRSSDGYGSSLERVLPSMCPMQVLVFLGGPLGHPNPTTRITDVFTTYSGHIPLFFSFF